MSMSNISKVLSSESTSTLFKYTACDVADALLKLNVPNAGYLSNLQSITTAKNTTTSGGSENVVTIAPASTVIFGPKTKSDNLVYPPGNIPEGSHWADLTPPGTILVISQPEDQKCAVLGGILAFRARMLDVKGIVVSGRVRDKLELNSTGISIWAKGTSIIGSAAESKALATQVTLNIKGTIVTPGDLVFCDSINGVVVIPKERVTEVVDILPTLTKADECIKKDVMSGVSIYDAFAKYRG